MFDTSFCFTPGKLTIILDGGAGSSGKGKLGSFITEHANNWQFACNAFAPQAGHWVKLDDGRKFFYQTLNSCAYQDHYEKLYIGPGATIELPAFFRELEENNIKPGKVGISPLTSILQDIDSGYERGTHDFDGRRLDIYNPGSGKVEFIGGYLAKTGTTAHGCGANKARRVLRKPEAKYARDMPELQEFLCDVPGEIMGRLDKGQAGLLEIAQGFQLSYLLPQFFPMTTSRNCSVAAGLDDMMVPPYYAGNVILNFRTYPIRINNNKYIDSATGNHLTWEEVMCAVGRINPMLPAWDAANKLPSVAGLATVGVTVVEGNSGPGYDDQQELTWEELTKLSGSPVPISEMTSVTKLPRRVFMFSKQNLLEAIRHNRGNGKTFLSLNFADYIDYNLTGVRKNVKIFDDYGDKIERWLAENLNDHRLRFIGTGAKTDDYILVEESTHNYFVDEIS